MSLMPSWVGKYFGEPWPSGVCEEGTQWATPVGLPCVLCDEPIAEGDQGNFMGKVYEIGSASYGPVHRECSLRSVLGGIGHLVNHAYWCGEMHDPDGGFSYRLSALKVWNWVQTHGDTASS